MAPLYRPAGSDQEFEKWIDCCRRTCLGTRLLPAAKGRECVVAPTLDALRLWSDICAGRRSEGYAAVNELRDRTLGRTSGSRVRAQFELLRRVGEEFRRAEAVWKRQQDLDRWRNALARAWNLEEQLPGEAEEFGRLLGDLRSADGRPGLLLAEDGDGDAGLYRQVGMPIAGAPTTGQVRLHLLRFGDAIHKLAWERIDYTLDDRIRRARKRRQGLIDARIAHVQSSLKRRVPPDGVVMGKIKLLRNRESHSLREDHWEEARRLQRDFARRLRRKWKPPAGNPFGRGEELVLTSLEGNELKVSYLQDVNRFLRRVKALGPDVLQRLQTEEIPEKEDSPGSPSD